MLCLQGLPVPCHAYIQGQDCVSSTPWSLTDPVPNEPAPLSILPVLPHRTFVNVWDIVLSVVSVFSIIKIPYEVAFHTPSIDVVFVLNLFIDTIFILVPPTPAPAEPVRWSDQGNARAPHAPQRAPPRHLPY